MTDPWMPGAGEPLPPRERHDPLIPMINVVFLLLIFFVMAGTFRAADALKVAPPEAAAEGGFDAGALTLLVAASGEMALGNERLDVQTAIRRLRTRLDTDPGGEVQVKADRATPASVIVPLLSDLAEAGIADIRLISVKPETGR